MKRIDDEFEYVGECCVCEEPVDCGDMGNYHKCGQVFHWGECGGWGASEHECDTCREPEKKPKRKK